MRVYFYYVKRDEQTAPNNRAVRPDFLPLPKLE